MTGLRKGWIAMSYSKGEILFKGKRKLDGMWVIGDLSQHKNGKKFIKTGSATQSYEVYENTICQYTGLNDRNGNMIWENDILFAKEPYVPTCPFSIRYNQETLSYVGLYDGFGKEFELSKELLSSCEVIGNIFDNSELLKGE